MEPKKCNKIENMTKQQQTHGHRQQTSGYQWGEGRRSGKTEVGLRGTNYCAQNKLQGHIVQHGNTANIL